HAFETLENRYMLSGNVTVSVAKGNLVIKGDNADNQITITSTTITGNGGTTVNGVLTPVPIPVFSGDIKMDLKGGNDTATSTGPRTTPRGFKTDNTQTLTNTGTLVVNGKAEVEGVTFLSITTATVNGKTEVEGTRGNDNLSITDSTLNGN